MRRSLAVLATTATALLCATALVAAPSSASAAVLAANDDSNDDDSGLAQVIDPNQEQGTGQVVIDAGHVDIGPTLNTGEWRVQLHDDTSVPRYWRMPADVVLKVNEASKLTVPDDEKYRFFGVDPGTEVYVVPQTQHPDVVWLGWNTQEPGVLDNLDLGATLEIVAVDGPGQLVVYLQNGNFGEPQQLYSTYDQLPQQAWIESNTHTHANWVFTEPGVYAVEVAFSATLRDGSEVRATDTLRFAVGENADIDAAFAAQAPEAPEAAQPAATEPQAASSDSGLGGVIWIVAGVVGAVAVIAFIIITVATARTKRRVATARAKQAAQERDAATAPESEATE